MKRYIILFLLFVNTISSAIEPPRMSILTVNAGAGVISGFVAASGGLEYEHSLTGNGSIYLTFKGFAFAGGDIHMSEFGYGEQRSNISGLCFAPGAKANLLGNDKRAGLGVGLSFPMGNEYRRDRQSEYSGRVKTIENNKFFAATLVDFDFQVYGRKRKSVFGTFITAGPVLSHATAAAGFKSYGNLYLNFGIRAGGYW